MERGLTIKQYLSLNRGKYVRKSVQLSSVHTGAYLTFHPDRGATDRLHFHDKAHLSYIVRGGVQDKRVRSEAERCGGDVLFFRSGEAHETIYHGFPVKNINLEFDHEFFHQLGIGEDAMTERSVYSLDTKFTMLRIYRELEYSDQLSLDSIELLICGLFEEEAPTTRQRPIWFERVIECIEDNWNADVSVDDLARVSGVHPKTISKYFSRFCGCTLGEYRRRLRVARSLGLIRNSGHSLTDIALDCGFYDQSHFISVFKHVTGFRPREFQKL